MEKYILTKSPQTAKKFRITTPSGKKVDFGATGYQDYTMHKDLARKNRYIARHKLRENWSASGLQTAGFWAHWLLWNKKSITASIKDIESKFGINIELH